MALGATPIFHPAAAFGPIETATYVPNAFTIPGCTSAVVGKDTTTSTGWAFTVTFAGVCPFPTANEDVCFDAGGNNVATGFTATCSLSGATLTIGGTGIFLGTPSVVTMPVSWTYGFCPNPVPLCNTDSGTVTWTV